MYEASWRVGLVCEVLQSALESWSRNRWESKMQVRTVIAGLLMLAILVGRATALDAARGGLG